MKIRAHVSQSDTPVVCVLAKVHLCKLVMTNANAKLLQFLHIFLISTDFLQ